MVTPCGRLPPVAGINNTLCGGVRLRRTITSHTAGYYIYRLCPLRAVAKCIRYADDPTRLLHEMETDPSFLSLPSAVYGVVKIATGMDWLKPKKKEDNNMQKQMSAVERFLRAEGEAKGIAIGKTEGMAIGKTEGMAIGEAKGRVEGEVKGTENTIRSFIERKRSRHVSEEDIFDELRLDFGLDIQSARRYMEPALAKA